MTNRAMVFMVMLFLGAAGAWAQSANSAPVTSIENLPPTDPTGNMDEVFPPDDAVRAVAEPIRIGVGAFSEKLEKIRATGREPLGLVLTGGSARAYAHIGVLEVLEEAGIRPDFIVANSMGAVIGMLYAAGVAPETIAAIVEAVPPETYLNLVLPTKGGLINADPFAAVVKNLVGDIDLADTKIPIIVTAEDLVTRRQVELAKGDFSTVMATTFAIPAIFEPVPLDGFLLIDGGVTNLVPVEIAAQHSSLLIVSTALYNKEMQFDNPISVINRAFDIGKTRNGMRNLLNVRPLVIRNQVENISYMQFSDPGFIIEAGRESARAAIGDIAKSLPQTSLDAAVDPALAEARKAYAASVPARLALLKHGALPAVQPSLRFKLRFKLADDYERSAMALDSQSYAGLSLAGASGRLRSTVSMLFGLDGAPGRQWGLSAGLIANPVDTLKLKGEMRLWGDFASWPAFVLDPDSIEALASIDWSTKGDAVVFKPFWDGVVSVELDSSEPAWATRLGFSIDVPARKSVEPASGLSLLFAVQTDAFADTDAGLLRYGPELTAKIGLAKAGLGALRLRAEGRFDMSGTGLSFVREDAFRGKVPAGTSNLIVAANTDIVWFAKTLEFDAGEMLLVKNIEIGPYFDCAWLEGGAGAGGVPDAFVGGLSLTLTASLVGLTPFDISLFGGIGNDGSPVAGIRSSRLFPLAY